MWRYLHSRVRLGDRGAAAVEFALILPLLLLFLFGVVQFGFLFSVYNTMTHAAREGARGMAVEQLNEADGELLTRARLSVYGGLPFTVVTDAPDPSVSTDLDVTVAVSVPMADAMFVDVLGLADGQTISTQVVMRRE
jgi:Flp pilus assembly protein TadG